MSNVKSVLGISLLSLSLAVLPACQKAKMTSVKKDDARDREDLTVRPRVNPPDPDRGGGNNATRIGLPAPSDDPTPPTRAGETGGDKETPPQVVLGPGANQNPGSARNNEVIQPRSDGSGYNFDESDEQPVRWLYGGATRWNPDKCTQGCAVVRSRRPKMRPALPPEKICKPIRQPSQPITNQLDVMFVVDTSNSIDSERKEIADKIDQFITELPSVFRKKGITQTIDVRMAVMLAHGPKTTTISANDGESVFGRPYVNIREEPGAKAIINVKVNPDQAELNRVKTTIKKRFNGTATGEFDEVTCKVGGRQVNQYCLRDESDTQGEAGLLALEHFITDRSVHYTPGQTTDDQVFPRESAALMIVFISNENDVCFDYKGFNVESQQIGREPAYPFSQYKWNSDYNFYNFTNAAAPANYIMRGYPTTGELKPHTRVVESPEGSKIYRDVNEYKAFMDSQVCDQGRKGQYKQIVNLLEGAKQWQFEKDYNLPIILGGILYPEQKDADEAAHDDHAAYSAGDASLKWFRDKEQGMGYIHLIHAFQGKYGSIRSNNFGSQLASFAQDATIQMLYQVELPLQDANGQDLDLSRIDLASIRVEAINPGTQEPVQLLHETKSARNHYVLERISEEKGYIRLHTEALERDEILPGALMNIYYREKR